MSGRDQRQNERQVGFRAKTRLWNLDQDPSIPETLKTRHGFTPGGQNQLKHVVMSAAAFRLHPQLPRGP